MSEVMREVFDRERAELAGEARGIIDALSKVDAIGMADYLLSALLAECISRKALSIADAPETLVALHNPDDYKDELTAEHYHVNGLAMLCMIRDDDLLNLACDILARLNQEQQDRDGAEDRVEYVSTMAQ